VRAERENGDRPPLMLRYPRRVLAAVLACLAVLIGFGFSLEEKLKPSTLDIDGTPVHRANDMLREHFGDSSPFVVLLRGPEAAVDEQGPELIRALREDPKVTTLSPWDRGAVGRLRPAPDRAFILLDYHVPTDVAVDEKVALLEHTLDETVHPPVQATQTGFATLVRTIQDDSIESTEHAEMIALPILLIVLLLVFRSPVAAAVPLGFGALAVLSSRGMLALLTGWFSVDALALTVCTMMGLALGVDYALLMVSRFREELEAGASPLDAAWETRRTAGRTTVFAGSTLVLSMVVALFIVPGALLASLAGTLALVVVLTVLIATVVGPPVLLLIGPSIDRWRIGAAPNGERSRLMTVVSAALRRPVAVSALIGAVVLVLAAPALALKTGPFSVGQLPKDNPARQDAELIQRLAGGGLEAPFVLVVAAEDGTITEPNRLKVLSRWQRRLANTPGVQSVVGPGQVSRAVAPLRETGTAVLASDGDSGPLANFDQLGENLGRAASAVGDLREGISQLTLGAGLLAEGSGRAEEGAIQIAQGLGRATAGGQEAVDALEQFADGTRQLAAAQRRAATGGLALKFGTHDLVPNLNANVLPRSRRLQRSLDSEAESTLPKLQAAAQATDDHLAAALQQIEAMTTGKADPNYGPALEAVRQAAAAADPLPAELAALQARLVEDTDEAQQIKFWLQSTLGQLKQLASASKRLSDGLYEISRGGNEVATNAARLNREAKRVFGGLGLLDSGAQRLAGALTRLAGGTSELEERLGEAYDRSFPLQTGLRRATVRVVAQNERLENQVDNVRRTTPGIFDSGYFVLSALDGTRGRLRERAAEAVDLQHGGQAATLLVIPRFPFNSDGSIDLNKRLDDDAVKLGEEADAATGVAGGPATLNTYSRVTKERMPWVIAAIIIATFLVLVLVLRAIPLAALAVALNVATVGVAFGVLTLLNQVPEGLPLGGRDYVDAVGATMIFGIVFGLSIDYAVFLLVRMREHYDRVGDNAAAIEFGLEKTARVITGAAAIMMAVFIAFAGAPIATVSQLGVGLTIAVLLDATVVRIVLLPALMLLMGDRVWWLPRPLERALPRLNV
jgi:putative drug exporter of the RND superfamily